MARINLLPWRQEARERKNREFLTLLAGVFLLSLLAAGAVWSYFNDTLDSQKQANEKIKQENVKLDKQLTEIASLEKQRDEMLTQMKVIQDLQGRRPIPVRIWNDIAKLIPAQMYLINMKREGDVITFKGKADNPNVVADFIRNLDASPWLENSAMKSIMQPQATAYAPASAPATTGNTNNSPAPRPVYPEDSYVEFVVTSTISKTSDLGGSTSSTAGTKVVTTTTTTSATATTVIPASSARATSAPTAVPASTTKPVATSTPAISNAPVAPVTNTTIKTTTTTTTKERSNG